MTDRLRVAVLFGGQSDEHEISLASARSVMAALDPARYELLPVGITKRGQWLFGGEPMRQLTGGEGEAEASGATALVRGGQPAAPLARADVVFPVLHGPFGEDGTVQGLLELTGLPYVGAGVAGSAVGMDKGLMKGLFAAAGLPQLPYVVVGRHEWQREPERVLERIEARLRYPLFTKPANMGSSVGISKARDRAALRAGLDEAARFDRRLVVEQGLELPREVEVAVLGNEAPEASIAGEIVPHEQYEFYDYQSKYEEGQADLLIPAPLSAAQMAEIRQLAVLAFQAVDGAGLARVDFFVDRASGALYLNEINTLPGFTKTSMYPKLWEATGLPYPRLLDRLIELALARHAERQRMKDEERHG